MLLDRAFFIFFVTLSLRTAILIRNRSLQGLEDKPMENLQAMIERYKAEMMKAASRSALPPQESVQPAPPEPAPVPVPAPPRPEPPPASAPFPPARRADRSSPAPAAGRTGNQSARGESAGRSPAAHRPRGGHLMRTSCGRIPRPASCASRPTPAVRRCPSPAPR